MPLHYSITPHADHLDVRLVGSLTLGPQLSKFGAQVLDAIASGRPRAILIEMCELADIDSAGLGELMLVYTAQSAHRGGLYLVGLQPRVRRTLEIACVSDLMDQFASSSEALDCLARRRRE